MTDAETAAPWRPLLYIREDVWADAAERGAAEHNLKPGKLTEILLTGYTEGSITVDPVPSGHDHKDRNGVRVTLRRSLKGQLLDDDGRLTTDDAPSLSRLVETLLEGYAAGRVKLMIAAAGHTGSRTPRRDAT